MIDPCDPLIRIAGGACTLGDHLNVSTPTALARAYPYLDNILWEGNTFSGEALYLTHAGKSTMLADTVPHLMYLWANGYIKPAKLRPSHSNAALMGLDEGARGRGSNDPPNSSDACAFDWTVLKGYP